MIVFIVFVFASAANGFAISSPMGRVVLSRGYVSRSRNSGAEEETLKKKARDLRLKCDYVNKRFPFTKGTSSMPPPTNFKNIYTIDQAKEFWDFQQKNCIPIEIGPREKIFLLSTFCLFITLFIVAVYRISNIQSYYGGEI
jgi:hypothetical protein